jgi:hypothetical protein
MHSYDGYTRHLWMKFFYNRLSIGIESLLSGTRWSMFGLSKMAPFQYASLFYAYYCFWLKMPTTSSWRKDHNLIIWSYTTSNCCNTSWSNLIISNESFHLIFRQSSWFCSSSVCIDSGWQWWVELLSILWTKTSTGPTWFIWDVKWKESSRKW